MKHIGDISQVHGWDLEPVDIIVGGSPCQDLSVAGKRKGLLHVEKGDEETSRSGLFHEQIRIIKEMRDYEANVRKRPTELVRPRFCIWENVPGAFSSNKGEDFRTVLEEFGKIKDPTFSVPRPENGKWEPAGLIVGNGFNIAWRTHSAEFWCVPQRRKRISVVIDFGSECTGEISFERKSMLGNTEQSKQKRKEAATEATDGIGTASESYTLKIRGGAATDSNGRSAGKGPLVQHELSGTLGVSQDQTLFQFNDAEGVDLFNNTITGKVTMPVTSAASDAHHIPCVVYGISPFDSNAMKSPNPHSGIYEAETARSLDRTSCGYPACNQGGMMVVEDIPVEREK